jgi:arginine deiminase
VGVSREGKDGVETDGSNWEGRSSLARRRRGGERGQGNRETDRNRANRDSEIKMKKIYASVGNRTRANCLEGNYDTISPRKLVDAGRATFTNTRLKQADQNLRGWKVIDGL